MAVVAEWAGDAEQPRERIVPRLLAADLVYVDQSGLDLCMTHQLHQCREADPCTNHVGSKGMPKPVRIGLHHACGLPVMTEQGTQTGRCHAVAARWPFERNE